MSPDGPEEAQRLMREIRALHDSGAPSFVLIPLLDQLEAILDGLLLALGSAASP